MFRHLPFLGAGVLALLCTLGNPGPVNAQRKSPSFGISTQRVPSPGVASGISRGVPLTFRKRTSLESPTTPGKGRPPTPGKGKPPGWSRFPESPKKGTLRRTDWSHSRWESRHGRHGIGFHGNPGARYLWGFRFGNSDSPFATGVVTGGSPGTVMSGSPGAVMSASPGGPSYTPGPDGNGAAWTDTADVMRAYAQIIKSAGEAQLLREEAELLRLEKLKQSAETRRYVESITPSWSEEQARIDGRRVDNARRTSNATEISSGHALNVLLGDLRKSMGKKGLSSPISLGEDVLKHLNVTAKENHGNLALLRNDGNFSWPHALALKETLSEEDRRAIRAKAQTALQQSVGGYAAGKTLADLRIVLSTAREKLARKVNDIPTPDYLEAKRFLNDFDAARIALENGEAVPYFNFQKWISGGKTIQEVADYMLREGLLFASARPEDARAYRAMHGALAAYDAAVNPVAATVSSKERP
jgi:hypothetical protein